MIGAVSLRAGLLDQRFRAHPARELVEHRRLPEASRRTLEGLAADPDHHGLLIPHGCPELGVLAVDRDLARLIEALREPGPIPAFARRALGPDGERSVARLVLDGVLEVAAEGGEGFIGGPAAHARLLAARPAPARPRDPLSRLACAALRLAESLPAIAPRDLSIWLYGYGALPASPAWLRRLGTGAGSGRRFEDALGLSPGGAAHALLESAYSRSEAPGWLLWHRTGRRSPGGRDEPTYKLYVSPHPRALAEVLPATLRRLAAWPAPAFKLGRDAHGVLRPDKLIVYLDDEAELRALAAALAGDLAGCPAHGVPFTAGIGGDGLLSWGMDPPRGLAVPGWRGAESWRLWVTDRLARALLRARALGAGALPPWRYALLRLELEGVRVDGWLPSRALWSEPSETAA